MTAEYSIPPICRVPRSEETFAAIEKAAKARYRELNDMPATEQADLWQELKSSTKLRRAFLGLHPEPDSTAEDLGKIEGNFWWYNEMKGEDE